MRKSKPQVDPLSLLDPSPNNFQNDSRESLASQTRPIVGISRDDALTLLDSGVLVDPRLRGQVALDRQANLLPVFPERIETWFEDDVRARTEREIPIGLMLKSALEMNRSQGHDESYKLAVSLYDVAGFVFRTNDELEGFRENVETMKLTRELRDFDIVVDFSKFGSPSEQLRDVFPEISKDQMLSFEKILRMTSAIAVSVCARRFRRGTSHAMRLLKGLPRKSPISERDNDTPLLDGILAHRWQTPPDGTDPIERLVYQWSDVILRDNDLAPVSVSDLLNQLEGSVRNISEFELVEHEISQEIAKLRDIVAGLRPLSPLELDEETPPLNRALGALFLFVMRRSPVDLLEMPRVEHLATEAVFMLAAYWSGLATRRTRLDRRLVTGAVREVLTSLEVASALGHSEVLPQAPLAYQISVEDSHKGRPFDLFINKSPIAQPFGASWRVERDHLPVNPPQIEEDDFQASDLSEVVAEYLFSDYEVIMSSTDAKVIIRKRRQPLKPSGPQLPR